MVRKGTDLSWSWHEYSAAPPPWGSRPRRRRTGSTGPQIDRRQRGLPFCMWMQILMSGPLTWPWPTWTGRCRPPTGLRATPREISVAAWWGRYCIFRESEGGIACERTRARHGVQEGGHHHHTMLSDPKNSCICIFQMSRRVWNCGYTEGNGRLATEFG